MSTMMTVGYVTESHLSVQTVARSQYLRATKQVTTINGIVAAFVRDHSHENARRQFFIGTSIQFDDAVRNIIKEAR